MVQPGGVLSPSRQNVMMETISMDDGFVEKVTMDYGSQLATAAATVGLVAARRNQLEQRAKENTIPSDVLGFAKANTDRTVREIAELKAQLLLEQTMREEAQAQARQEKQARTKAERQALSMRKDAEAQAAARKQHSGTPRNFSFAAMRPAREELYQRAAGVMKYRSHREEKSQLMKDERKVKEAGSLSMNGPTTPHRRGYDSSACSPSVGREERGWRTPGDKGAYAHSVAPGRQRSISRRTPWAMSQPRRASQSVSVNTWSAAHSEIARQRSIRLGLLKVPEQNTLPQNAGAPVCSFFSKNGYCNAFETRGRCAFSHEKQG